MIHLIKAVHLSVQLKRMHSYIFVALCFIFSSLHALAQAPGGTVAGNEQKMQEYNQQAVTLLNSNKVDEAVPFIKQALEQKENATSYYYLCHIHDMKNEFAEAVKAGERAIQLEPSLSPVYVDLFYAYTKVGEWKKAEGILDEVKKADPEGKNSELIETFNVGIANDSRGKILITILLLAVAAGLFLPVFNASKESTVSLQKTPLRFTEVFLLSGAVSCMLWTLFFACSHIIWSYNPPMLRSLYTPSLKIFIYERDGIESFVLYLLMIFNMALTVLLTNFIVKIRANKNVYLGIFSVLFIVCAYYFYNIGFFPPMAEVGEQDASRYPMIFTGLAILSIGGYLLYNKFSIIVKVVLVLLMSYACLVMILPTGLVDLSFILYPGLRMMYGAKIPEIYFQYDLFMSFLALLWFKMNYALDVFPYLGQVSFLLFFLASFFFADKFFKSKGLSVVFIIALVLIRYYAIWEVGAGIIQVTPLRLDLWIIPLVVAYWKGIHHWLVGLFLGLLVMFHRNLGLIYLSGFVEVLITLYLFEVAALVADKQFSVKAAGGLLLKHVKLNLWNLLVILASIGLCFVLFKELFSPSALIYRKIGVGMMQISIFSFYWFVPIVLSSAAGLLYRFQPRLGYKYTAAALFMLFLTIGESMYFYGRSHENNILNVSGALVFALFILFDILIYLNPEPQTHTVVAQPQGKNKKDALKEEVSAKGSFLTKSKVYLSLPFIFLFVSGYYYSGRIAGKIDVQYNNFKESQYVCPLLPMAMDTTAIRKVTNNSPNVYFLDFNTDFYYYYYGHYKPVGYFNPLEAWIYKKDLLEFLQGLLDKHYYLVYDIRKYGTLTEYVPYLNYNRSSKQNDMVAISKDDVKQLLPETTTPSLMHIALLDTWSASGIGRSGVDLGANFAIELIVKPSGPQLPTAAILHSLNRMNQLKGLILQSNNGLPGQYMFAFSNGQTTPTIGFQMEDSKWHYLTITVAKDITKVYDNGKMIGSTNTGGLPIMNSEIQMTIGNNPNHDGKFNGYIREVKIGNAIPAEADIISTGQKLDAQLNSGAVNP